MSGPTSIGTLLLSGHHDGPRLVESRTSPLRVYAAPWTALPALLEAGLPSTAGIYLLTGRCASGGRLAVRPGEAGDLRRRLLEHAADPGKVRYEEVYAVSAADGRLTKSDVRYLEARVHEVVLAGGLAELQVDRIPAVGGCSLADTIVLEELLGQSRELLYAAGARVLDAPRMPVPAPPEDRDDGLVELVESGGVHPDEHALDYDRCWSWGYPVADGGFVVRAGSDVRRRQNSALLPGIAARRARLLEAGLLGEMPGVTDRWRLLGNFRVSSPLIAAKVVTGAHLSNSSIWRRLAPANRIVAMDAAS